MKRPRRLHALAALPLAWGVGHADEAVAPAAAGAAGEVLVLDELEVSGQQIAGPEFDVKSTTTTFDLEAIQSLQPGSVFDILATVPGVDLTGGPRANGISINVRGFSDNEDVLVIVDGAVKNFEKYRFGSVLPEPELLRELTVSRGPASVLQGSGAVGGVIEMETRDAADFLAWDERVGGFVKVGFNDNNHEVLTIGSVYGRPTPSTDALVSYTRRESENLTLSTGEELPLSDASPEAVLAKMEWGRDAATVGLSYSATSTQGLELFDTSAFRNGVNGQVYRETEDRTWALYTSVDPLSDWVDLQATVAYTDTTVDEQAVTPGGELLPRGWDYQYDIWSARLHNASVLAPAAGQQIRFDYGLQALEEERTTVITNLEGAVSEEAQLSQPSGRTLNWAPYLQATWEGYGLTATAGYRWDHSETEVLEPASRALLAANGLPVEIEQEEGLLNYRLDYRVPTLPVALFHSYVEAARYPKIDEYFTQSVFSRCLRDSSDAEELVTRLELAQRETGLAIDGATAGAAATITEQVAAEIAARDSQIASLEAARQAWIAAGLAAVANGDWTQAQYDTNLAVVEAATDDAVAAARLVADNNVGVITTAVNDTLAAEVGALEAELARQFAEAGLPDPAVDLDRVPVPTRTTLPEPYQSVQICGALFEPETVESREWGASYVSRGLMADTDLFQVKLTYFETEVDNVLESINTDPANPASQPGREEVRGIELESTYFIEGWRFDLTYNRSRGEVSGFVEVDNPDATNALDETMPVYRTRDKLDMPADEVALAVSWISPDLSLEVGVRASHKFGRDALQFVDDEGLVSDVVRQPDTTELDLSARWQPHRNTVFRLNVDNITNEQYRTPSGITEDGDLVLGNFNVGRAIKLSWTQYF